MTQTDTLLGKLYHQLQNSGESFSMTYFSDHGLAFKERGKEVQYLAHDDKYQQNFQVPFMVLSSDDKAHKVIKARRSANDFLSSSPSGPGSAPPRLRLATVLSLNKPPGRPISPTSSYRKWTIPIWVPICSRPTSRPAAGKRRQTGERRGAGKKIRPSEADFLYHRSD
jgi:hypothetical protein